MAVAVEVEAAVAEAEAAAGSVLSLFTGITPFACNGKDDAAMILPVFMEVSTMLLFTEQKKKLGVLLQGLSILFIVPLAFSLLNGTAFAAGTKQKAQKISQKTFSTPEDAAQALVTAAKADDAEQLLSILGPDGRQLVFSGDEVEDRAGLERFARAYDEKNQLVKESEKKAVLEVGNDGWPVPIPIVQANAGNWRFDTKQGKEEILNRRIGKNELSTIQASLAFVHAQREFASKDRSGDGVLEYAQKFVSDKGEKNGLFWEANEGEEQSPLGPLFAMAKQEGYKKKSGGEPTPYHGYFYKILKSQGKNAPRGAYDYVANGRMVGGFAMVAFPAQFGVSGIMTFIVSHDGVVYEKNLGKGTASAAQAMKSFNPDKSWRKLEGKDLKFAEKEGGA